MGQIVKRKKKGRPSKADLARRSGGGLTSSESEPRRSLRRRNVRYNVDYDDFLEEDDEDEEEDERRREKKLKLVVKLNQGRDGTHLSPVARLARSGARDAHAPEYGSSASEWEDDEPERKPLKERRIGGGGEEEDEDEDYDDQIRGDENEDDDIDEVLNKNIAVDGSVGRGEYNKDYEQERLWNVREWDRVGFGKCLL